jgi:hypothetical protein
MNYALTGLFTAAATLLISGIATANPIAIGAGGLTFGLACAGTALNFLGQFADAFIDIFNRNSRQRPAQNKTAGYVLGAALGVMAGLGFNELTQPDNTPQAPAVMPQEQVLRPNIQS